LSPASAARIVSSGAFLSAHELDHVRHDRPLQMAVADRASETAG
jgi:hypothetical protein